MTTPHLFEGSMPTPNAIVKVLEDVGIEYVFGMPGGDTGRIVRALVHEKTTIEMVTVRHESLGAAMAEIYGRLRGRPGVFLGQGPWALGFGVLGILEAQLSSSPMIILTDVTDSTGYVQHGPYQLGSGGHGAWDARQSYAGLTKEVFAPRTPNEAVHAVQLACKHALAGERGPVAVVFSGASLRGAVDPEGEPRLYATSRYLPGRPSPAAADEIERAADALRRAERPVLIAGNGVRIAQACDELAATATTLDIPVATTAAGKGCFPEVDPLAVGVFGNFGIATANAAVAEADLILAVGTKLGASDTPRENPNLLNPTRQTLIQIDVEPLNAAWTFPSDHVLIGDAATVLEQLRASASGMSGSGRVRTEDLRTRLGFFDVPASHFDSEPIMPERVIAEIQHALGQDGIVTCDAGENRIFMTHFFQTQVAGSFLSAPGAGPMGFAIPAAMATKLLYRQRPVVAVAGDGGFAMTMNGLLTAIEYQLPIVVVVLNNAALGWLVHGGTLPENGPWRDFDYAAIATAMGCHGTHVEHANELAPSLTKAIATTDRPTVIDVQTSSETSFQDITSPLVWGERS